MSALLYKMPNNKKNIKPLVQIYEDMKKYKQRYLLIILKTKVS